MDPFLAGFADELTKLAFAPSPYVTPQTATGPRPAAPPSEYSDAGPRGRGSNAYLAAIKPQEMKSPPKQDFGPAPRMTLGPKMSDMNTPAAATPTPKAKGSGGGGGGTGRPPWETSEQRIHRVANESSYNQNFAATKGNAPFAGAKASDDATMLSSATTQSRILRPALDAPYSVDVGSDDETGRDNAHKTHTPATPYRPDADAVYAPGEFAAKIPR